MLKRSMIVLCLPFLLFGCAQQPEKSVIGESPLVLKIGHFPDIVHTSAMVGKVMGFFQEAVGPNVTIEWRTFDAGPSAIKALIDGELDLVYIGPDPTIRCFIESGSKAMKIICGASSGGAGLVVREDSGINQIKDLRGKTIATPEEGNTQDVTCRTFLKSKGLEAGRIVGDVRIVHVRNVDLLRQFNNKEIDAAWTKEPWLARLIIEGGGKLLVDERNIWPEGKFVTAHLVASTNLLRDHPRLVRKWIEAHIEATEWFNFNPEKGKALVNSEITKITGQSLSKEVLDEAYSRTTITYDPVRRSLFRSAANAYMAGFLGENKPSMNRIYDLSILNQILAERGLVLF